MKNKFYIFFVNILVLFIVLDNNNAFANSSDPKVFIQEVVDEAKKILVATNSIEYKAEKLTEIALKDIKGLSERNVIPGLAVVLVGDNPASRIYVKNKGKFFLENGCYGKTFTFASEISQDELIAFIEKLNILNTDKINPLTSIIEASKPD